MTMEWNNDKVITFLEILQTEPCLWDPKLKTFKNRRVQGDAWRRVLESLPFKTTIEEMKKKKESLMGYYRTHLNRLKNSLKSGAGKDEVYTTNWFAFETMDNFLRGVYDSSRTLNTELHDENEAQESNDGNVSPLLSIEIEEVSQNKPTQNYGKRKQPREELPQEIKAARRQIDEASEIIKGNKDEECEMFGKLIASKLKRIRNTNTRDTLMNDIHNLIFRVGMTDRLEQRSECLSFLHPCLHPIQTFMPSSNSSTYQTPPGHSTSLSPHHQEFSPSSNSSTYQSPPNHSTSRSPHHPASQNPPK